MSAQAGLWAVDGSAGRSEHSRVCGSPACDRFEGPELFRRAARTIRCATTAPRYQNAVSSDQYQTSAPRSLGATNMTQENKRWLE
jgi:hypothetical protein